MVTYYFNFYLMMKKTRNFLAISITMQHPPPPTTTHHPPKSHPPPPPPNSNSTAHHSKHSNSSSTATPPTPITSTPPLPQTEIAQQHHHHHHHPPSSFINQPNRTKCPYTHFNLHLSHSTTKVISKYHAQKKGALEAPFRVYAILCIFCG